MTLANNSVRTIWKGAEDLHAFGNFPNFAVSKDGKFAAAERSSFETPPEIWAGPIGEWRQLTSNNTAQSLAWGKAQNLEWKNEGLNIQGWLLPPRQVEAGKRYPMVVLHPRRTFRRSNAGLARFIWNVEGHYRGPRSTRLLRPDAESSREATVREKISLART